MQVFLLSLLWLKNDEHQGPLPCKLVFVALALGLVGQSVWWKPVRVVVGMFQLLVGEVWKEVETREQKRDTRKQGQHSIKERREKTMLSYDPWGHNFPSYRLAWSPFGHPHPTGFCQVQPPKSSHIWLPPLLSVTVLVQVTITTHFSFVAVFYLLSLPLVSSPSSTLTSEILSFKGYTILWGVTSKFWAWVNTRPC